MKKFLFKLFIFVVLIFGIGILMWIKSGNTIYTNAYLSEKLKFLEQNPHFNTVFIGSSKVNNQINPEIIDQINPKLKSYNLGANASFNLENFETIDYLLESEKVNLRYLILELQNKVDFTKSNLHSERSFSALTPQNLWFDLKYQWQEKDVKQIAYTLYSSVLNIYYFKKEQGELKDFDLQKTIKKMVSFH